MNKTAVAVLVVNACWGPHCSLKKVLDAEMLDQSGDSLLSRSLRGVVWAQNSSRGGGGEGGRDGTCRAPCLRCGPHPPSADYGMTPRSFTLL